MFCRSCKKTKSKSEFHPYRKNKCKQCVALSAREKRTYDQKVGIIYFVYAPEVNRVKIGFTARSLDQRLPGLQGQSPCNLEVIDWIAGTESYERKIHAHFENYRLHGEWFEMNPLIKKFIKQEKKGHTLLGL